jgi:hypothetical protein
MEPCDVHAGARRVLETCCEGHKKVVLGAYPWAAARAIVGPCSIIRLMIIGTE